MALKVRLIGTRSPLVAEGLFQDSEPQVWGPCIWPEGVPIPQGWEEIELVTDSSMDSGTVLLTRNLDGTVDTVTVDTPRTRKVAGVEFPSG